MFRTIADQVWAFDVEWVPDPVAGRALYELDAKSEDRDVMLEMWLRGGASEEDPMPYLKTVLCRIVTIAAVVRKRKGSEVSVVLHSLPKDLSDSTKREEREMLTTFFDGLGKHRPQLVGFNSQDADLRILVQRAIVNGIHAADFCRRPEKPWEGVDYFAKTNECSIDLKQIVGGFGRAMPSLHEIAVLSGIPGKMDVQGQQVAELWLSGQLDKILAYNECDALTTYLLWLRVAHFGGHFSAEEYRAEQELVRNLIVEQRAQKPHLGMFLDKWESLNRAKPSGT